jgi:putative phosphoesterase
MKLAVLADIHANFAALQAVADHLNRWQPDAVIVAGDTVNRGPRSLDCLRFVQERQRRDGWKVLRGNHEEYVISVARDPAPRHGIEGSVRDNVRWTCRQLGDVTALETMLDQATAIAPDGSEVRVTHASMRGNRDSMFVHTPAATMREQIAPAPALFCSGHTHIPFVRQLDTTLVVNAGSVGLPFDGDHRACYARVSWRNGAWEATLIRVPYDRQQTERDYKETGFLDNSGPAAELILDEFHSARSRLFRWVTEYEPTVLAGEMSVTESVAHLRARLALEG